MAGVEIVSVTKKSSLYLGMDAATGLTLGYDGDGHMLTVGPTRSGKSRRLLIPNLLYKTGRSMLVIDIKGELAAITAKHRTAKGSKVLALDPFGELVARKIDVESVGFNPMRRLDPDSDSFADDAMVLAEALIQVNSSDPNAYFSEAAQDMVAGLIMLVRTVNGPSANLGHVRREISRSVPGMEALAKAVMENEQFQPAIRNKLGRFEDTKESREMAGTMSTAQVQTRFLDSPAMVRSLSDDGIDFQRLKTEPLTIYLVLPPQNLLSHAKWLRLVVSSAMSAMQRKLTAGGAPRSSVVFMLDEFPQLGKMQTVENAVALNAGYGVKVWAAVQHFGQLKSLYGDNWETFLSAGCVTAFAPRDVFTRDHLTKMIGTGTKQTHSLTFAADGSTSTTRNLQKDDRIAPWQWQRMKMGEQYDFIPTDDGLEIRRVTSPDFTKLKETEKGWAGVPDAW